MFYAVEWFGNLNDGQLGFHPPLKTRRVGAADGLEQALVFVVGFVAHAQNRNGQAAKNLAGVAAQQEIAELVGFRNLQRLPSQEFQADGVELGRQIRTEPSQQKSVILKSPFAQITLQTCFGFVDAFEEQSPKKCPFLEVISPPVVQFLQTFFHQISGKWLAAVLANARQTNAPR